MCCGKYNGCEHQHEHHHFHHCGSSYHGEGSCGEEHHHEKYEHIEHAHEEIKRMLEKIYCVLKYHVKKCHDHFDEAGKGSCDIKGSCNVDGSKKTGETREVIDILNKMLEVMKNK